MNNEVEMIYDDCMTNAPVADTYMAEIRIKNGSTLPAECNGQQIVGFAWNAWTPTP